MENNETTNLTDEFLELYRQLEQEGRLAYFPGASTKESIIGRLMSLPQMKRHKENIDFCRVVRNFLVHTPKVAGHYSVTPSPELVEFLRKLITDIKNPVKAIDYAIKINNMYTINLKSNIIDVVQYMQTMGYTHVPILENGKIAGVFSPNVIYTYLSQVGSDAGNFNTELSLMKDFISVHSHINEYFAFRPVDISLFEVSQLFKIDAHNMKRLAAVFLTDNGTEYGKLLAMLTPYSILRDAPDTYW